MSEYRTLLHAGWQRRYRFDVPIGFSRPMPMVVMLHGAGGTGDFAAEETNWSEYGKRHGFVVAYPDAVAIDPAKPQKFLTNPAWWNDGSGRGGPHHFALDDVGLIRRIIETSVAEGIVDPSRVVVTGFSNGAAMTFRVGAELADVVMGIAPVAGHCWLADPKPSRPISSVYLIGTEDPLIPVDGGTVRTPWGHREDRPTVVATLQKWANAIDCKPEPIELSHHRGVQRQLYPSERQGPNLEVITVAGLGHHWPGGPGKLGERLGGKIASPLDATQTIADFFELMSHKHPG